MENNRLSPQIHSKAAQYFEQQKELYGSKIQLDEKLRPDRNFKKNSKSALLLKSYYEEIKDCQLCSLGSTRTKFVFGVGNPDADLLLIGEAPGKNEDLQGEPFVGRAGQLLDKILDSIGLSREEVYIANVLKCRPPNNRDPLKTESDTCKPYLQRQIEIIKPKLILALGRISGVWLTGEEMSLGDMRGKTFYFGDSELMVTYHPAALLRNPNWKRPCWEDMQKVRDRLKELTTKTSIS